MSVLNVLKVFQFSLASEMRPDQLQTVAADKVCSYRWLLSKLFFRSGVE